MYFSKHILTTSLSVDECAKQLQEAIDPDGWIPGLTQTVTNPVLGRVKNHKFIIRRLIWYGDPLQPVLKGRFLRGGAETLIEYRVRMRPSFEVFLSLWLTFSFIALIKTTGPVALVLPILAIAAVAGSWLFNKADEPYLAEFLERTLEARKLS